jgi:hypothetical protein
MHDHAKKVHDKLEEAKAETVQAMRRETDVDGRGRAYFDGFVKHSGALIAAAKADPTVTKEDLVAELEQALAHTAENVPAIVTAIAHGVA